MKITGKDEISRFLSERAEVAQAAQDNLMQAQEKHRVLIKKSVPALERESQLKSEIAELKAKRAAGELAEGEDPVSLSRRLSELEQDLSGLTPWLDSICGARRDNRQGPYGPAFIAVQNEIKEAQNRLNSAVHLVIVGAKPQFEGELAALFSSARDLRENFKAAVGELLGRYHAQALGYNTLSVDINKFRFDMP